MNTEWRRQSAPRFTVAGALIGALGGAVYWLGAQLWPTSVAVVLAMLATTLPAVTPAHSTADEYGGIAGLVFALLVKYNALMALSAANLPFALPANVALGVIMIAGHASSSALVASIPASPARSATMPASHADLGIALAIGFAPAALIGLPGLVGFAAAIAARIALVAYLRRRARELSPAIIDMTRQMTEVCFYLGALAAFAYV
jgi:cobalamin synthase